MDKIDAQLTSSSTSQIEQVPIQRKTESIIPESYISGATVDLSIKQKEELTARPISAEPNYYNSVLKNVSDMGTFEAAFEMDNTAVNAYQFLTTPNFKPESDFNILDHKDKITGLDEYIPDLVEAKSTNELNYKIAKIAKEQKAREVYAESSTLGGGLALIASNLLDPVNLASTVVTGGSSLPAKIGIAVGTTAAQEAILQGTQTTRTTQESLTNVAMSGITIAGLNGIAKSLGKRTEALDTITTEYNRNPNSDIGRINVPQEPKSLSAAAVPSHIWSSDDTKLSGFSPVTSLGFAPNISVLRSDNTAARQIVNELTNHPFELAGHVQGKTVRNVESIIDGRKTNYIGTIKNDIGSEYNNFLKSSGQKMTLDDFKSLVTKEAFGIATGNNFAATASKSVAKMFSEIADDLQSLNPKTNVGISKLEDIHSPFLYQSNKVRIDSSEFMTDISSKLEAKINLMGAQEQQNILDALNVNSVKEASDSWASEIKDAIAYDRKSFNKLKGTDIETPLDKNDLSNWFISDAYELSKRYVDLHLPKIELEKKFGSFDYNEIRKPIIAEFEAKKLANPGQEVKIDKEFKKVDEQLRFIFNNITNESKFNKDVADTALNNIMKLSSSAKLGSATLSSLTDVGKLVMINGISKVFKSSLTSLIDKSDIAKLSKNEMTDLSHMLDDIMHNRTNSIAGIVDKYTDDGILSKSIGWISEKSMRASLLPHWTKTIKVQAGYITADKITTIGNKLLNSSKVSKKDLIDFAKVGLDETTLKNIAEEFNKHGKDRLLNISNWDPDTAQVFKEGLSRYINKTINTPSASDIPKYIQSPIGRVLFQFQSFGLLNWNQYVIAGLQRPDANFLSSVAGISAIAYLQLNLKEKLGGSKVPKEWEGMDGIGAKIVEEAGLLSGILTAYDKFATLVPGYSRDEMFGTNSRDMQRVTGGDRVVKFIGPSAGYLKDITTAVSGITSEQDFEGKQLRALRSIMPMQNTWYLKGLFNHVEGEVANGLNINNYKERQDTITDYLRENL